MGKLGYINYLDGFRGFCCMFLVGYHWPMPTMSVPFGWEVLQAFFVMSGYLITRILVHDKTKNPTLKDYFTRFMYRRSFRIFPLYFAYIGFWALVFAAAVLANIGMLKQITEEVGRNFGFLMTYTYNFMGFANLFREVDYLGSPIFGHLWSLSLEEQFYLFFPLAVFFLNRKHLLYVCIAIVVLSPLLRYVGFEWLKSVNDDTRWAATNLYRMAPFQMDSFAIGAILALTGFKWIKKPVFWTVSLLIFTVSIYVFVRWYTVAFQGTSFQAIGGERKLELWLVHNYQHVYILTLVNLGAAMIFMCFERGYGLLPKVFNNNILAYLGKISYGIYILHMPVLLCWLIFYTKLVPQWINKKYPVTYELVAWFIYMGLLLSLSHLCYKYFEEYFLRWKERLDAKKYAKLRGEA